MLWQGLLLAGLSAAQDLVSPTAEHVQYLGVQKSVNANIGRDLGWTGKVGDTILATYGDTHTCGLTPSKFVAQNGCSVPTASNSVARVDTKDPTKVYEFPQLMGDGGSGNAKQFCAAFADEPDEAGQFAIGITQIQQVSDDESMLFFLINNRTDPNDLKIVGSGVAKVSMEDGVPQCERVKNAIGKGRTANYFWDGQSEPNYGAYASMSGVDGYIYGYGEMANDPNPVASVFVNRVPWGKYNDLRAYEYWNGQNWQTQRLRNPSEKAAVMSKYAQSSAHYSKYYQAYLMMGMNGAFGGLSTRLAKNPEGPWTKPTAVWSDGACWNGVCSYGGAMMPWYDPSGRTTAVSYTPVGSSTVLKVVNVTWDGSS